MTEPLVLGIETSCDETGAGLVRGRELLADSVASSVEEHARFGGVVPEVASRAHLEAMVATVDRALATAGVKLADIDAIAVTAGPGLAGALLVGVCAAKAYALALGKPLYAVNHLAAHIAVDQLEHGPLPRPTRGPAGVRRALLAAARPRRGRRGGAARGHHRRRGGRGLRQGGAAAGHAVPRRPAGGRGRPGRGRGAIAFPRGKYRDATFDFSFSGLKTAVARYVEGRQDGRPAGARGRRGSLVPGGRGGRADSQGGRRLPRRTALEHLIIGGGVAANSRLRALAAQRCEAAGIALRVPRPGLCTDNGAMVAALGAELVARGAAPSPLDVAADSSLPVTEVVAGQLSTGQGSTGQLSTGQAVKLTGRRCGDTVRN